MREPMRLRVSFVVALALTTLAAVDPLWALEGAGQRPAQSQVTSATTRATLRPASPLRVAQGDAHRAPVRHCNQVSCINPPLIVGIRY